MKDESQQSAWCCIINPYNSQTAPGFTLVFGGDVTHAGMPADMDIDPSFCAHFQKTHVSPEDRLHGLQTAPPSPNFKIEINIGKF
jgi:hypothetical protein